MDIGWGQAAEDICGNAQAVAQAVQERAEPKRAGRPIGTVGSGFLRSLWRRDGEFQNLAPKDVQCPWPASAGQRLQDSLDTSSLAVLAKQTLHETLQVHLSTAQQRLLDLIRGSWDRLRGQRQPQQRANAASITLDPSRPMGSTTLAYNLAAAQDYEGSVRTFVRDKQRVSMCNLHFSQMSWRVMLQALQTQIDMRNLIPKCILKSRRYDETPTKLRLPENDRNAKLAGQRKTAVTAKVFQTKFELGFLMECPKLAKYVLFRSTVPCPLQLVDSCTIENVAWCQREQEGLIPGLARFAQQFKMKVSLPASDRHWSNKGAEKGLLHDDLSWTGHHFLCDIHKAAQIQKCQSDLMSGTVSAMLMLAVSSRQGNALDEMKDHLKTLIYDRLDIKIGTPPGEYATYRRAVHDVFLTVDTTAATADDPKRLAKESILKRRVVLEHLLNGDLQRHDAVEFWMPNAEWATPEQVKHVLGEWLVPALLPGLLPPFPRSRWTGADLSLNWCGLLESHHGLLRPLVQLWVGSQTHVAQAVPRPSEQSLFQGQGWGAVSDAGNLFQSSMLSLVHQHHEQSAAAAAAAATSSARGARPAAVDPELPSWYQPPEDIDVEVQEHMKADTGDVDWASFNAAVKAKLGKWSQHDSLSHAFLALRITMAAPLKLLRESLSIAGAAWEQEQAAVFASEFGLCVSESVCVKAVWFPAKISLV